MAEAHLFGEAHQRALGHALPAVPQDLCEVKKSFSFHFQ